VGPEGFEPSANGLKGRCSTAELQAPRGKMYHTNPGVRDEPTSLRRCRTSTLKAETPVYDPGASKSEKIAQKAHPVLEPLVRLGYLAKGIIYGLVGILAFMAARGNGGKATDQRGAIDTIASYPLGSGLLYAIGTGLFAYALWRIMMAWFNPEDRQVFKRIGYAATGIVYGGIGYSAFEAATGSKTQQDEGEKVRGILSLPLGQWIVAAMALILAGLAIAQFVNAYKGMYLKILKLDEMSESEKRTLSIVGRVGLVSRGAVFLLVSWFFLNAALKARAQEAGGFDEALRLVASSPRGPFLLGAAGLGLLAYGMFMGFVAKYRKIEAA
jgi:hypothetical protein